VDDTHKLVAHKIIAQLALHDAGAEALVHQLTAGSLATFKVLANALAGPGAGLVRAAFDAELDELGHRVFLGVVVVGLHHVELVIVRTALFAERLAILARLQLDDPDALPGGSAVLFDHAWLESHCLLETRGELLGSVVCQCVLQSDLELCNLAERILGAHKFHDIRARPHLLAQLAHLSHGIVELALVAAIGLDLAGVATHDECIELLSHLEELVVLVVHVMNQLAAHAGADHPVGNWDGVVAVAVGTLVAATEGLVAYVDANKRRLELRLAGLREQSQVVLCDLLQGRNVHGAGGVRLPHACGRARGPRGLVEDDEALLTHEVAHPLGLEKVLLGDVVVAGLWCVLLAVSWETFGNAHARAVELAHNPLLVLRRCARRGGVDEVSCPPKRNGFGLQSQVGHHLREVQGKVVLRERGKFLLLRPIEGVDGARATDCGDAALLGLLVDDAHEGVADHVVAQLAFHDARAEALVDELAAGCLAALEVPASPLGGPIPRLAGATADAELDELAHGVLLGVVVVCLHEIEELVVGARALAIALAVVASLELDDPDALTRGPAVLLDDAGLERHGLLEASGKLLLGVVRQRVFEADVELGDLAEGVLGAHLLHHVGGGPHLYAELTERAHAGIKLALVAPVGLDLSGVAADDDGVEALAGLEERIVLVVHVVDELAAHARIDHAVGDGDRVVAVAVGALVRAAVGSATHVDLGKDALELRALGLRQQAKVVLGHPRERRDVHGP